MLRPASQPGPSAERPRGPGVPRSAACPTMGPVVRAASVVMPLPRWTVRFLASVPSRLRGDDQRMRLALGLAGENVRRGTGGPFGAAVFERGSGRLLSVGVNVVVRARCALAHAEMVALGIAERRAGIHELSAAGLDC